MKKKDQAPDPESLLITQSLLVTEVWVEAEHKRLLESILPWMGRTFIVVALFALVKALGCGAVWQPWMMFSTLLVSIGMYFYAQLQCQRGRTNISSLIALLALSLNAFTMSALFQNLIVAYAILGLLIGLLGSVLLSLKTGYVFSLVYTVAGVTVFILQQMNLVDLTLKVDQDWVDSIDLLIYIVTILFGMYLVSLNHQGTQRALNQLVEQSNELKLINRRLESEIRQRKRAEAALASLNVSLEATVEARTAEIIAEKEKSETILHNVGDAIGMAGLDMKLTYINEAFTTITGYSAEAIIGKPVHVLIGKQLAQQELQELKTTLANGESWQGEVVARRKDGRTYDAVMTIVPVRDAAGHHVGYAASHQDISHVKNLERARSRFITNISHELRTPVATLKLYAHMLKQEISPERREKYRDVLEKQTSQLEALIEDIIEITALDSGKAVTVWDPITFGSLIEGCMASHQSQAAVKGIALRLSPLPPAIPTVKGDQHRLSQALHEIIENAVIFTPAGGEITLALETQENHERTWVVLSVHDTGPGIAPDEKESIFGRFYRGKLAESGHVPGTGLGLSIVYEIMRAHGGQVTVESQEGAGSTFKLWLPAIPDL